MMENFISNELYKQAGDKGISLKLNSTQSALQKVLRDKYNIHIVIRVEHFHTSLSKLIFEAIVYKFETSKYSDRSITAEGEAECEANNLYETTYEEALDKALTLALKFVK